MPDVTIVLLSSKYEMEDSSLCSYCSYWICHISDLQAGYTNLRPCDTNLWPCDTNFTTMWHKLSTMWHNLQPCDTNLRPCDTNLRPWDTNLRPCDTNLRPYFTISEAPDAWNEDSIKMSLYLYLGLLPSNHKLIHG